MNGASAAASAAQVTSEAPDASLWSSVLVTMLALAFVLALAWLFLRLLKRATTLRSIDGRAPPQVVQAVPLGGRERLIIVRDGDHEYVLGVTTANVSLIDKRATAPSPAAADPDA